MSRRRFRAVHQRKKRKGAEATAAARFSQIYSKKTSGRVLCLAVRIGWTRWPPLRATGPHRSRHPLQRHHKPYRLMRWLPLRYPQCSEKGSRRRRRLRKRLSQATASLPLSLLRSAFACRPISGAFFHRRHLLFPHRHRLCLLLPKGFNTTRVPPHLLPLPRRLSFRFLCRRMMPMPSVRWAHLSARRGGRGSA